jgi:twinkle protein
MWHINTSKTLCICEGQIDAMAIWQSGFKNVVSVAAGSNNYFFLTLNFDWINQFDDIVIWADNDDPGRKLASTIKAKFNNARVIVADGKIKDANDMLLQLGESAVFDFITREPELPNGAIYMSQQHYSCEVVPDDDRIETGFKDFDRHLKDIRVGEFTIVFGRDGEGKSTFISQLLAHRILQNRKTFLFSAELGIQAIQEWMYKQLIGNNKNCYMKVMDKYGPEFIIKRPVITAIQSYVGKTIIMLDRRKKMTTKELIETMKVLATRNNVRFFVIDNLQSALEENASSLNSDQANFAEDLRMFAITHKVSVMLVAHPRKVEELDTAKGDVESGNLAKDDISGTKNMSNKAHNIISVERDFDSRYFDLIITLLKDKRSVGRKSFKYKFSKSSYRYHNATTPQSIPTPWIDQVDSEAINNETVEEWEDI